jgi:hypothetical protein
MTTASVDIAPAVAADTVAWVKNSMVAVMICAAAPPMTPPAKVLVVGVHPDGGGGGGNGSGVGFDEFMTTLLVVVALFLPSLF